MNLMDAGVPIESTSAAGAMRIRQLRQPALVGLMLVGLGTSTKPEVPAEVLARLSCPAQQTTSGLSLMRTGHGGEAISELRRLSGFTWDQLARLFKVSRRSLHFWASGKPMTPANEAHLQRVLAVLRKADRGSATANRRALLGGENDGVIPFDLLVEGRYDAANALLRHHQSVERVISPPMSAEAKQARAPQPPEQLVDALHDSVHSKTGAVRAAKSVRKRGGGRHQS